MSYKAVQIADACIVGLYYPELSVVEEQNPPRDAMCISLWV